MDILSNIVPAVLHAGLPLLALSFALVYWAMHRGRLRGESVGELQKNIEALGARRKQSKAAKKSARKAGDGTAATLPGDGDEPLGAGLSVAMPGDSAGGEEEDDGKLDPVLEKWFSFGGGFYGVVALYTWILIEWDDVWGFVSGAVPVVLRFDIGSLISLMINLFIESIMNFIAAIAWPVYWLREADNPWVWIIVAYGGYWLGIELAQRVAGKHWAGDEPALTALFRRKRDRKP